MNIPQHMLPARIGREEEADYKRRVYFLLAPPGVTPDHVVDPDYWVHWAQRLRINDRIEIVAADGSFDMDVRVVALDPRGLWARVRALRLSEGKLASPQSGSTVFPDPDGYLVEWGGEHRWRIIRGQDVVARDFPTQADAIEALQNIKAAKAPIIPLVPRMSDPLPEEPTPLPEPLPEPLPVEEPPGEEKVAAASRKRF